MSQAAPWTGDQWIRHVSLWGYFLLKLPWTFRLTRHVIFQKSGAWSQLSEWKIIINKSFLCLWWWCSREEHAISPDTAHPALHPLEFFFILMCPILFILRLLLYRWSPSSASESKWNHINYHIPSIVISGSELKTKNPKLLTCSQWTQTLPS